MKAQHTPGPWISYPSPKGHAINIYDGRDGTPFEPLAIVQLTEKREGGIRFTDERQGNASLITAAPDLLAALQNCLSAFETHYVAGEKLSDHYTGRIERARAAIAKAKGEEVPA